MATQFDLFGDQVTTNRCRVTLEAGGLALRSPYIRELVEAIKMLPYAERRWDGARKVWVIDPKHGKKLAEWILLYANETVTLPSTPVLSSAKIHLLDVRYIGTCKIREDGSISAFGWMNRAWSVIFPESVLRAWFEGEMDLQASPTKSNTLYQILGVKQTATDEEIKSAFRRMAKQWHPDVCKEPDASEMFMRIQEAYRILSELGSRARYDAGLALQARLDNRSRMDIAAFAATSYRPPLRCGLVMVEGIEKVGRVEVAKILEWQDITHNGKTLVTSWPAGAKEPVEIWS